MAPCCKGWLASTVRARLLHASLPFVPRGLGEGFVPAILMLILCFEPSFCRLGDKERDGKVEEEGKEKEEQEEEGKEKEKEGKEEEEEERRR